MDDVALLERDYGRQGFSLSPEPYSNANLPILPPPHSMEKAQHSLRLTKIEDEHPQPTADMDTTRGQWPY